MDIGQVQRAAPVLAPTPAVDVERAAEKREIIQAVKAVNATELFGANQELTFMVDRSSQRAVIRLVDRETRDVIRQIPPEYVLRAAEDLDLGR
jgi:flagellar protein FlaG